MHFAVYKQFIGLIEHQLPLDKIEVFNGMRVRL